MRHDEYLRLDATALAALVGRGEVDPRTLLGLAQAQLARGTAAGALAFFGPLIEEVERLEDAEGALRLAERCGGGGHVLLEEEAIRLRLLAAAWGRRSSSRREEGDFFVHTL